MEGADFGSRLSGFRKKYRLSQKDLAQKLHVHITTIKNWEGGGCYPDFKNINSLADLFNTSTDYLMGRASNDPILVPNNLPPKLRRTIERQIQVLIDNLMDDIY